MFMVAIDLIIAATIFGVPIAIVCLPLIGIVGKKAFRK